MLSFVYKLSHQIAEIKSIKWHIDERRNNLGSRIGHLPTKLQNKINDGNNLKIASGLFLSLAWKLSFHLKSQSKMIAQSFAPAPCTIAAAAAAAAAATDKNQKIWSNFTRSKNIFLAFFIQPCGQQLST